MIPIYVCCHTKCRLPDNEILVPIQAGRRTSAEKLDMLGDDSGENLSSRNANYCELSALYWIWRNTRHECFGLCHYRRFFDLSSEHHKAEKFQDFSFLSGYTETNLNQLMQNYDLILPCAKTKNNGSSLYQLYSQSHYISDMDWVMAIIRDVYPQMLSSAETALFNQPLAYYKNMMITRRVFADTYCRWLFDVLHRLDCIIYPQLGNRPAYQQRVYGFLAERLFNVFLEFYRRNNFLRIKEVPLLLSEDVLADNVTDWPAASNI